MTDNKVTFTRIVAIHATIFTLLLVTPIAFSEDTTAPLLQVPPNKAELSNWFSENIQPLSDRKATLNASLVEAEEASKVIKVRKDGSGDFETITEAINSIPTGNKARVIVWIGGGVYKEKIRIERSKPFVTLYGSPDDMPILRFDGTAKQYGTVDSATLIAESNFFMAANLIVVNTAPRPEGKTELAQAAALRISGDQAAFYNCKFYGFQGTLCDDRGRHFFKDCYIEGTVDFIFGSGTSIYMNTELYAMADRGLSVITAQARDTDDDTGYVFLHCTVSGSGNGTFLGRAWRARPRVVFAYTSMSNVINPLGWTNGFDASRDQTVFYAEYKSSGPGSNINGRAKFTKQLTDEEAAPFLSLDFIDGFRWILPPPKM